MPQQGASGYSAAATRHHPLALVVANTSQSSGSLARAVNKVMPKAEDALEYAGGCRGLNRKAEDKTQRRSQDADNNVSFSLLLPHKKLRIIGLTVARSLLLRYRVTNEPRSKTCCKALPPCNSSKGDSSYFVSLPD